jgi:hypothetical protein
MSKKPQWEAHSVHAGAQRHVQQRHHRWVRRKTAAGISALLDALQHPAILSAYLRRWGDA